MPPNSSVNESLRPSKSSSTALVSVPKAESSRPGDAAGGWRDATRVADCGGGAPLVPRCAPKAAAPSKESGGAAAPRPARPAASCAGGAAADGPVASSLAAAAAAAAVLSARLRFVPGASAFSLSVSPARRLCCAPAKQSASVLPPKAKRLNALTTVSMFAVSYCPPEALRRLFSPADMLLPAISATALSNVSVSTAAAALVQV